MVTNRHAYLILAHNQPRLLQVLIDMIDDERNDIYIHVDKKVDMNMFAGIHTTKSRITYTKRVEVYWGDRSKLEAEFILYETARKSGPYFYYHLLSGVDLPLKNQDYIHHFFDDVYSGHEFVGFAAKQEIDDRVRYYYLFKKCYRVKSIWAPYKIKIRNIFVCIQKKAGIWRNRDVVFCKGAEWVSITDDLCQHLINNKKTILRLFYMTLLPDESYFQTLVYNSRFYDRIHDKEDEYNSCMRYIDWEKEPNRPSPHTWTCKDWDELTQSDRLFARKFSEDDMDFIYRLRDHVLSA